MSAKPKARSSRKIRSESKVSNILRCRLGAESHTEDDELAAEEPLEIRVKDKSIAVTMRTPGHDRELAAGFLLSEGLIHKCGDITAIVDAEGCEKESYSNVLNVVLSRGVKVDFEKLTRHVFATSSCGVCGKASIEAVQQNFPPVKSTVKVVMKTLVQLPEKLRKAQETFSKTGGLHAAAIFDRNGKMVVMREDVGRHNAVDKVLGFGLIEGLPVFSSHIMLVSGRASFEIMQKALAGRIPIVCAVSAPSSLAVEFARESGQTLVGFLRGETMNIYSGAERIR